MKKTSGQFKTKHKLIEFIGAKGSINFISNEATIEGKQLAGLGLDDLTFKLTLYEDGTVDFDDVEGQETSSQFRENLLDVIFEKTIVGFRKKMVVSELTFKSVQDFDGKKVSLYLSVEYTKPIEKLASIFDDVEVEVTEEQISKLDNLLSIFDDEQEVLEEIQVSQDIKVEELKQDFDVNAKLEESFKKMKQEKVETLKKELEQKRKDLSKFERDRKFADSKIEESKSEIRLLESRIESIQPDLESNGWVFNVSERLNEKILLEQEIYDIIKAKVDKVKGINSDAFMKLFEDGEFKIRLAQKNDDVFEELTDTKQLEGLIISDLKLIVREDGIFYVGDFVWAEIVNKFIKMGFSQDPEWDKICKSNSYNLSEEIN